MYTRSPSRPSNLRACMSGAQIYATQCMHEAVGDRDLEAGAGAVSLRGKWSRAARRLCLHRPKTRGVKPEMRSSNIFPTCLARERPACVPIEGTAVSGLL